MAAHREGTKPGPGRVPFTGLHMWGPSPREPDPLGALGLQLPPPEGSLVSPC